MSNVKVNWSLPTTRTSGKPLDVSNIAGVELAISADGGVSFAVTDVFPADVLETVFTDLEPGTWEFRGVVIDQAGKRSAEAFATVAIEDTSAPGAVTLVATLQ